MKKYFMIFMLFAGTTAFLNAQTTVFDPATYSGALPAGMEIVDIGGTDYLQIILDGWGSSIPLDMPIAVTEAENFTCEAKMALNVSDTLTLDQINTFLKLADRDFGDIAVGGVASTADFVENTIDFGAQGTIANFQFAGQVNGSGPAGIQWSATVGDTLWVGAVNVFPARVAAETTDTLVVENNIDALYIRDDSDYKVIAEVTWDLDSLYILFTVWDDTIYNDGASPWTQDNIELYLDMDNSKGAAFDHVDDFQFRLMNDSSWSSVNTGENGIGGVRLINTVNIDGVDTLGYSFDMAFAFDSIVVADTSTSFIPGIGVQIGFDILASDNDGAPSHRDQLSWNSVSGDLWNTPNYWGVLQLEEGGKVAIIPDTEAPTAPPDLVVVSVNVETGEIEIDWEPSEDNTRIGGYIVSINDAAVDTVTATRYTAEGLSTGTYNFSVVAVDIYWNESEPSEVSASITGIINVLPSGQEISIYPNPAFDVLMIKTTESIEKVEIVDISGKTVLTKSSTKEVNVSGLNRGVYIIKVQTENGVYTSQFLKD